MPKIFEIYVQTHFSAAHFLEGYPGDCARIHGHNWAVEVFVRCRSLDKIGIGMDFRDIKKAVKEVVEGLDHRTLNEVEAFHGVNPTSENIAMFLYHALGARLASEGTRVARVKVSETPGAGVSYWEE